MPDAKRGSSLTPGPHYKPKPKGRSKEKLKVWHCKECNHRFFSKDARDNHMVEEHYRKLLDELAAKGGP